MKNEIMEKKQKVRYEFYEFSAPTTAPGPVTTTLKLNNPAEVRFNGQSFVINTGRFIINNVYRLCAFIDVTNGTADFPSELILTNNENEIDVTIYTVQITPGASLFVTCKYFVSE